MVGGVKMGIALVGNKIENIGIKGKKVNGAAMDGKNIYKLVAPPGSEWIMRSSPSNNWTSVCYGDGLFVAVANTGTGNRVMTSPDGITWTIRTSAADNSWTSVCYAPDKGLFVAVANTSIGNRVMTSRFLITN